MAGSDIDRIWRELDAEGPPTVAWCRPLPSAPGRSADGVRAVLLLGAFDPPTRAHVAIVRAASRFVGAPGAFCLTNVLLARPADVLLQPLQRLELLDDIADECELGLAVANRGTYLEVSRALQAGGIDASFVIGSDKLEQLADPSFYVDGKKGAEATFAEVGLVVVPREGSVVQRGDVTVLDVREVFDTDADGSISSTEVRRRIRAGRRVDGLVPPGVAAKLAGYTAAR